jgi:hypothetical protein
MAKSVPSDIIYCDASKGTVACKVAADGIIYPNGLAKGPRNLLYQGSTLQGLVRVWEEKPDHTLKAVTEVPVSFSVFFPPNTRVIDSSISSCRHSSNDPSTTSTLGKMVPFTPLL